MRLLSVLCSHTNGESVTKLFQRLEEQNGNPYIVEKVMEPNAIGKLIELSEKING